MTFPKSSTVTESASPSTISTLCSTSTSDEPRSRGAVRNTAIRSAVSPRRGPRTARRGAARAARPRARGRSRRDVRFRAAAPRPARDATWSARGARGCSSTVSSSSGYGRLPAPRQSRTSRTADVALAAPVGDDEVLAHRQLGEQLESLERARQAGAGAPLRRRAGDVGAVHDAPCRPAVGADPRARRSRSSSRRRSGRSVRRSCVPRARSRRRRARRVRRIAP